MIDYFSLENSEVEIILSAVRKHAFDNKIITLIIKNTEIFLAVYCKRAKPKVFHYIPLIEPKICTELVPTCMFMIKKFSHTEMRFWIRARPEKFAKIAKTKDLSKFSDFDQAVHNEKHIRVVIFHFNLKQNEIYQEEKSIFYQSHLPVALEIEKTVFSKWPEDNIIFRFDKTEDNIVFSLNIIQNR